MNESLQSTDLRLQIELIQSSLKSAERIAFPKKVLMAYAGLILVIPVIESILPSSWWVHVATYGVLFAGLRWFLIHILKAWSNSPAHPIISESLIALQRFTLCSALLLSYSLFQFNQMTLIFPMLLIHIAFLFFSFGKYSSNLLRIGAYCQLALASLYIILLKDHSADSILAYFTTLFAGTFLLGAFGRD